MSQRNKERLKHAEHNYEVCQYLNGSDYNDWTVTTAFYAAVHYVRYAIFPITVEVAGEERTYQRFPAYADDHSHKGNRHYLLSCLVGDHLGPIGANYDRLKSICYTARYRSYETSDVILETALEDLEAIREYCLNVVGGQGGQTA